VYHKSAKQDCPTDPKVEIYPLAAAPRNGQTVGDAGINMSFVMAQVVGRGYSPVLGFVNRADASRRATLIKKATARQEVVRAFGASEGVGTLLADGASPGRP
jgi:hypothetical protein